jgi:hypothetical protein
MTTVNAACVCPACHRRLEHHTSLEANRGPRAGDISMCGACGNILVYMEPTILRVASLRERLKLAPERLARLTRARELLKRMRKVYL